MASPTLPQVFLWPHFVRGPYSMTLHWGMVDGHMEVVGIDLRSFPADEKPGSLIAPRPGGFAPLPVTTSLLRQLRLAEIINEERAVFVDAAPTTEFEEMFRPPSGRGGRPPLTDEELQKVAEAYRKGGAAPTRYVAEKRGISYGAAAKQVMAARRRGFLAATKPGKANKGTVPRRRTRQR